MAVIDLGYVNKQAKSVPEMLGRHGLPTDISDAIALLSSLIRNHAHFGRILSEMEPEERAEFYHAVVPNLRFTAKPLEIYISEVRQEMDRHGDPFVSNAGYTENPNFGKPLRDGKTIEKEAQLLAAEELAARTVTLVCAKCTYTQKFVAVEDETPAAVLKRARLEGWIYDYQSNPPREICPTCPTSLRKNG